MSPLTPDSPDGRIRIGELSRRTGVSADTLRAWERRYSLLRPSRSDGGFRLYSPGDEERVQAMRALLSEGLSAAEAARLARARRGPPEAFPEAVALSVEACADRLRAGLANLDEAEAHAALDQALSGLSLDTVVQDVVQVTLAEMGERWSRGEVGVGEEHFATNLLRGRLLGLARGWGLGTGPLAVLACPPDEMHELGLVCFGLILRSRGWRVALLGSDTPINAVGETATHTAADLVVLSAVDGARFDQAGAEIRALADRWPVVLGGAGADAHHEELGARVLPGGPVDAALFVSGEAAGWR